MTHTKCRPKSEAGPEEVTDAQKIQFGPYTVEERVGDRVYRGWLGVRVDLRTAPISPSLQRILNARWSKKIADDYDSRCAKVTLAKRTWDSSVALAGGQHCSNARRLKGLNIQSVDVWEVESEADEKHLVERLNEHRDDTSAERFLRAVTDREPNAVRVAAILEAYGRLYTPGSKGANACRSPMSLPALLDHLGGQAFEVSLRLGNECWKNNSSVSTSTSIYAVAFLYALYRTPSGDFPIDRVAKFLRSVKPEEIDRLTKMQSWWRSRTRLQNGEQYARYLAEQQNAFEKYSKYKLEYQDSGPSKKKA